MALNIPFLKQKKKDKSISELRNDYLKSKQSYESKFKDAKKKDPIGARLAAYGFAKPVMKDGKVIKYEGQETFEKFQHNFVKTEFPDPVRRFRLVLEYPNFNIENSYYWYLAFIQETWGFDKAVKVIDTMASSVASSSFGNFQSRLGAQQSQASQYLKGISEMVKGLFQIVRELRILDERLQYYYDSDGDPKGDPNNALSSEIVLKGLWIDQVEGGAKNPGSVYGLAQTIGFTILPDIFFRIRVKDRSRMEAEIDKLKFNAKVKEVLKRKLRQYYVWKDNTKKELEQRRMFEIRYLRQHYDTIKLYMSWVKPYLRNIQRLKMYEKHQEDVNIINAFETQIIEIETLFYRSDFDHVLPVLSLHIFFRVKPELSFHSHEYQHKGPIYAGMADMTLRAYAWDHHEIHNYIKYRQEDDLELMSSIDKSVEQAMDALGDELRAYLRESDPSMVFPGDKPKEEPKQEGQAYPDILDPFVSVFKGFADIGKAFTGGRKKGSPKEKKGKPSAKDKLKHHRQHHRAEHFAIEACWETYYRYKMGPGDNLYWVE